jgi:hypothetical protein
VFQWDKNSKSIPSGLKLLLQSNYLFFVGHRIKSVEVRKLKEDWDVIIKNSNFDSTERICKDRKWVKNSNMSLAKLTEIVLGYSLDGKDDNSNERNSDWTKLLTIRQKVYAAHDGLLSF